MAYPDFRVLATVGEADQLSPLLTLASALARSHDGAVTVLCVTPDGEQPDWLQVPERYNEVSVRTVVRQGQDAAKVILEATRTLHPDLLMLGWRGSPGQRRYLLGSTLDPVIRLAPCDVAVVRVEELGEIRRALVPVSTGPNSPLAIELALQLADQVEVTALNVVRESLGPTAEAAAREQLTNILEPWEDDPRLSIKVVRASNIIEGIMAEASANYDILLVGASNESYIDRKLFGNVPQTIAADAPPPTVVVRRRASPFRILLRQAGQRLFSVQTGLSVAEQVETYREVHRGARGRPDFFVLIGLAAGIATMGLLMDSAAIVIGAMVIAPLVSAILGVSLAVVQGDARLLWRALLTTLRGAGLAIVIGAALSALVPGKTLTSEILSRTQPTLFDLTVALLSGTAAAYAQCRRSVLSALSGVAIAVALVPPLVTIGIGLTMSRWDVATGALLLFLTNLSAIVATGSVIFLFFGFRPDPGKRFRVFGRSMVGVLVLLLAVSGILTWLTATSIRASLLSRQIDQILSSETGRIGGVQLESWKLKQAQGKTLEVEVDLQTTGTVSRQDMADLQERLETRLGRPVALVISVTPLTRLEPLIPAPRSTPVAGGD